MSTCTALVPVQRFTTEELLQNPAHLLQELFQRRQQANYWKAQFQRSKGREAKLQQRVRELEAKIRQLEHELFGKKSEKKNRSETSSSSGGEKRRRGQQPDNPAPKRRSHEHLPIIEESRDLPEDQKRCPRCSLPYESFPGTEDSETIEIEVRAHRRVIRRKRYRPACQCTGNSGIITASRSPKLIPKGRYGISVWTQVLLDKFLFFRPSHRLIADLATHGIELPPGTLAGGLQRIAPMLELLYQAIEQHCQDATHWHADETGWKVFVKVEEKPGHKRTLWVYRSCEAIFFAIALTKGTKEAEAFFGPAAKGILNVDRASNYKALTAVKEGTLLLAFCWTHTRRDFLDTVRGDPGQQDWAEPWIQRIGELFHVNKQRVAAWKRDPHGPEFTQHDAVLRARIEDFRIARDEQRKQEKLPAVRKRILTSLVNHWDGLMVFVDHPDVPMDNSEAERQLRGPAMGRKNYWGSGAKWAGELAERCFSLFATLLLAGINVRTWLTAFLTACAEAGGKAPAWSGQLLPWNLSPSGRQAFQQPLRGNVLCGEVRCYLDALAEQAAEPTSAEVPTAGVPPVAEPPPSPFAKGTRRRRSPVFPLTYSGRQFSQEQLQQVRALIAASPNSSRTAISRQVCQLLHWRKADGGWKEVSCRVALLRMHEDGWLALPPPRRKSNNGRRIPGRTQAAEPQTLQEFSLPQLGPPRLEIVTRERSALWNEYIDRYHYLGYAPLVGAQLRYFVYAEDRLLALFGYGASAWRLAPRDRWIGWSDAQRQVALPRVVGQVRFLILPWIRCPNLASKLLSLSANQLPADWEQRYGIRPWLLESFVDTGRFEGICYRAANWIDVGRTQGRGKKDRRRRISLPRKQVFLYPLCRDCRKRFSDENSGERGQRSHARRPQINF
jgi:transposase